MMLLLEGTGTVSKVVCPYHAWTYGLSGKLMGAGHMEKSNGFDKKIPAYLKFVQKSGMAELTLL